jgi:hypothetical protein
MFPIGDDNSARKISSIGYLRFDCPERSVFFRRTEWR